MAQVPHVDVTIPTGQAHLYGMLTVPASAQGIVVFAHGSGSSRFSPRNNDVADRLNQAGFGTLLFDLLTESEDVIDRRTRQHRFDIPLLGTRLVDAIDWLQGQPSTQSLGVGLFGASTGAAAALIAAAEQPDNISAVVSRGGRPDLAGEALSRVKAPTLLIVGERDTQVIEMNQSAQAQMKSTAELVIVPGATHLFEEPGTMDQVTRHTETWFRRHLLPEPG